MSASGICPLSTSLFTGSSHQSFQGTNFHTAGKDMFMPIVNVNFTGSNGEVVAAPSLLRAGPLTGLRPSESESPVLGLPAKRAPKRRLLGRLSHLFKSKKRERTVHQDSPLIERAHGRSGPSPAQDERRGDLARQCSSCSSSAVYNSDGISVCSANDASTVSLWQSAEPTKAETYILEMHKSGKGLAAWDPRPRKPYAGERGVVPGDVGTFSAESGFKKTFNIFEDERSIRASNVSRSAYTPPKLKVVTYEDELPLGHTIVQGTSTDIEFTSDGRAVASGAFRCLSSKGAVLALTSSADLDELENHIDLREFIIDNAQLLYRYANSIRRLDDDESLYFVTGCIKSDSWALAAFNEPVDHPNDVLRLVQSGGSSDASSPTYAWTSRGTAEVRSGSNSTRGKESYTGKNQCLFLRGYKMAFSPEFRSRMSGHSPGPEGPDRGHDSPKSDSSNGGGGRHDGKDSPNGGDQSGNAFHLSDGSTSSPGNACSDELPVVQPFPMYRKVPHLHPCDSINEHLLDETQVDCAISHDDDWRFAFEAAANDHESFNLLESNTISVCNGVAFLTPTPRNNPESDAAPIISIDSVDKTIPRFSIAVDPSIPSFVSIDETISALKHENQENRKSRFFAMGLRLPSLDSSPTKDSRPDAAAQVDEVYQIELAEASRSIHEVLDYQPGNPPIQDDLQNQSRNHSAVIQPFELYHTIEVGATLRRVRQFGIMQLPVRARPYPHPRPGQRSNAPDLPVHQHVLPSLGAISGKGRSSFVPASTNEDQASSPSERASCRSAVVLALEHPLEAFKYWDFLRGHSRVRPPVQWAYSTNSGREANDPERTSVGEIQEAEYLQQIHIQDHLLLSPLAVPMDRRKRMKVMEDARTRLDKMPGLTYAQRLLAFLVIVWLVSTVFITPGAKSFTA